MLKRRERMGREDFAALDRLVTGTSWGVSIAFDGKKRNARKWASIRNRSTRSYQRGLTGDALERAVMAIGQMFPSNVIHGAAA